MCFTLFQLEEDTLDHYKKQLRAYRAKEIPIYQEFESQARVVRGCTSQSAVETSIRRAIYDIMVEELKTKWHNILTNASSDLTRLVEENGYVKTCNSNPTACSNDDICDQLGDEFSWGDGYGG